MTAWSIVTPNDLVGGDKSALVIGPFGSDLKTSDFVPQGVPLIFVRDIRAANFSAPRAYVTPEKANKLRAHIALPGDVLVTKMGDPPGDTCIYTGEVPAVVTADCIRLRPSHQFDAGFIVRALRTSSALRQFAAITTGAAQQKVSLERFRNRIQLRAPLLSEQLRIVAILDNADALLTKRRLVLASLDDLPQSVFHQMFGDSATAPLGRFVSSYSGGTPSKSRSDYWTGTVPWFSAKDLKAPDLHDSRDHVSDKVPTETNLKVLPANTIAVVVRGMILAHTVPVSVLRVPSTINQDLKALLPKSDANVDFLASAIRSRSSWILARISSAAHGTKRLESSVLASIPIPDARAGEQLEFVSRLHAIEAYRDHVEAAVTAGDELFTSLQSRAFRGEL